MIFTRIVAALLATAACAQALHVPDALSARDIDVAHDVAAHELSERTLHHLNAARNLAENNNLVNPDTRDLSSHELTLRSVDALSQIGVTPPGSRTPSPGPYECKTKADCQKKIDYANHQVAEARTFVTKWTNALKAAGNDAKKKRDAKNNLDTARGSLEHWQEEVEAYTNMKATMKS